MSEITPDVVSKCKYIYIYLGMILLHRTVRPEPRIGQ